jgi:hypothetical protein
VSADLYRRPSRAQIAGRVMPGAPEEDEADEALQRLRQMAIEDNSTLLPGFAVPAELPEPDETNETDEPDRADQLPGPDELPVVTRRPEPQVLVGGRAPLCPDCWYLEDGLGHFWAHR